jgi:hypothetical protein
MENALVHPVGDVVALSSHITALHDDRALLAKLRTAGLGLTPKITWISAGARLLAVYRDTVAALAASRAENAQQRRPAMAHSGC